MSIQVEQFLFVHRVIIIAAIEFAADNGCTEFEVMLQHFYLHHSIRGRLAVGFSHLNSQIGLSDLFDTGSRFGTPGRIRFLSRI